MEYLIACIIIGLVILIHEAGHLAAAKAAGIPVQTFSVGYGPRLFGVTWGGTEYRLSLVPLGGYLMPAMKDEKDYFAIPVMKRIFLAAGGPAANILFSMILFGIIKAFQGLSLPAALAGGVTDSFRVLGAMAAAIPRIFSEPEALTGIVGIVAQGGRFVGMDVIRGLHFASLMGLNLALVNLLPFPVFDGGKILLCAAEAAHPALRRLHLPLSVAGWILILFLMVYVTVGDVGKLI